MPLNLVLAGGQGLLRCDDERVFLSSGSVAMLFTETAAPPVVMSTLVNFSSTPSENAIATL